MDPNRVDGNEPFSFFSIWQRDASCYMYVNNTSEKPPDKTVKSRKVISDNLDVLNIQK